MKEHITRTDLFRNEYRPYVESICLCGWQVSYGFNRSKKTRKVWREIGLWARHHETLNDKERSK